jgi:hypothetical protein
MYEETIRESEGYREHVLMRTFMSHYHWRGEKKRKETNPTAQRSKQLKQFSSMT